MRPRERACPHCGASLRDGGGRVAQTSIALLMGLSLMGCGDAGTGTESDSDTNAVSTAPNTTALYGVPSSGPEPGTSSTGSGSDGTTTAGTTSGSTTTGDTSCETEGESDTGCETETEGGTDGTETEGDTATTGPMTGGQPLYGAAETADP